MQLQCWRACCELVSLGVTLKTCKVWAGRGTWDAQMPSDAAAYTLSFLFLLFPLLEQIFPCWYKRVAQPPDAWALISIVGVKYACLICRHLHRCSAYLVFLEPSNLLRVDWILTCLICPALISWTSLSYLWPSLHADIFSLNLFGRRQKAKEKALRKMKKLMAKSGPALSDKITRWSESVLCDPAFANTLVRLTQENRKNCAVCLG